MHLKGRLDFLRLFFFYVNQLFKVLICYNIISVLCVCVCVCLAARHMGSWLLHQGLNSPPLPLQLPTLEGKVLTTGLPGKSHVWIYLERNFNLLICKMKRWSYICGYQCKCVKLALNSHHSTG